MAETLSRRSANVLVKDSGMCWVMSVPALLAGNARRTVSNAVVPPVEAPMARILLVVTVNGARPALGASLACATLRLTSTYAPVLTRCTN